MANKKRKGMTVRELQAEIRRLTNQVNARIISYRDTEKSNDAYDKAITRLKRAGSSRTALKQGKVSQGAKGEVGLGLRGKRKSELREQLRGLYGFIEFDKISPEAQADEQAKYEKAYRTFASRYDGNLDRETYEELVNIFAASKDALGTFYKALGAQGILDTYRELEPERRVDLVRTMEDVIEESKRLKKQYPDLYFDTDDMVNLLRARLSLPI